MRSQATSVVFERLQRRKASGARQVGEDILDTSDGRADVTVATPI